MIEVSVICYLAGSASLLFILRLVLDFRRIVKSIHSFPGHRLIVNPATITSNIVPWHVPGVVLGRNHSWNNKHDQFKRFGSDIISGVSAWPHGRVRFWVADAAVVKEITSARSRWPKPIDPYKALNVFGHNILTTEGDRWKRHRKIASPAFSEPNNKLVWEEAVRITIEMINEVWENKEEIVIDHAVEITLPIALFIIGSAGFGRKLSFSEDLIIPKGHTMPFKDALHIVSSDMILSAFVPKWTGYFSREVRRMHTAFKELNDYMQEMIDERRTSEKKVERHDLFSSLLNANEEESKGAAARLSDSELIGDIFIFLLAGHETTAHTLCFAFGLLAFYQDQQEILYQNILKTLPDGRLPKYEDMGALSYVTSVFHETLRLFPPVVDIPKECTEDTTLATSNEAGERIVVPIPKGSGISLSNAGLHYNPRYWKEPYEFRPQRFSEDWPRDAFLPFSGGARSCIGRRFSETEATAILAVILARYRIEIKEELSYASETFEQRKERIFAVRPGVTMTPIRIPLVFKRR